MSYWEDDRKVHKRQLQNPTATCWSYHYQTNTRHAAYDPRSVIENAMIDYPKAAAAANMELLPQHPDHPQHFISWDFGSFH